MTRRILISGTHLTPALELIRQLQQDQKVDWQISYIGRESNSNDSEDKSIESRIIPSLNIEFYPISCGKLDRRYLPNTLFGIPKTIKGFYQSFQLINKLKPDIVVSFGGYVSVPVIFMAALKGIKTITHEQTLTNSLTTKINANFATKIALSFNNQNQISQLPKQKVVITGNLLRFQIFKPQLPKNKNITFKSNLPIIYITAGNQGSHRINSVLKKIIPELKNFNIIHQTGKFDLQKFKKLNQTHKNYLAADYFDTETFSWIINHSQIFISRSGANTSQEIVALHKKSILIPLPKSQQDEQTLNALWVKKNLPQTTVILKDDSLSPQNLLSAILHLSSIKDGHQKITAKPNLKLLDLIHDLI